LGPAVRFIHSELANEKASTVSADVGGLWKVDSQLWLAAVLANMGPGLKYIDESTDLPTTLRVGAAYAAQKDVILSLEGSHGRNDFAGHVGVEWTVAKVLALRLGYRSEVASKLGSLAGLTAGVGVKWMQQEFSYAFASFDELGSTHYVSVLFRFNEDALE
jgi:hypothetical protein